jgi:hypothetical protein
LELLTRKRVGALIACAATLIMCAPASAAVTHTVTTVNGLKVDRYAWPDSHGRPRTVSLKREGEGNPGHGGYAVRMTYQAHLSGAWHTIVVNSSEGFGYFVSHEAYRNFTDGAYDTIAHHVFDVDDSPLGRAFPVDTTELPRPDPDRAAIRFATSYPRYGTIDPIPKDANGEDSSPTPTDPAQLKRYTLPVRISWFFQSGTDFPRVRTSVGLGNVSVPDRVNFDVRGPYGVMDFDRGDHPIDRVMWGDRLRFTTSGSPLTRNSDWTWNQANSGARYTALIAGSWEMGLVEPHPYSSSALVHGFAYGRGKTSNGYGCKDPGTHWALPCDWEWPYQSAQYSLPYDNPNGSTTYEKIAWGSAPYYGAGSSLSEVYDSPTHANPFVGFPASKRISYDVCVVLGRTIPGGLTRSVAAGPNYRCASP